MLSWHTNKSTRGVKHLRRLSGIIKNILKEGIKLLLKYYVSDALYLKPYPRGYFLWTEKVKGWVFEIFKKLLKFIKFYF